MTGLEHKDMFQEEGIQLSQLQKKEAWVNLVLCAKSWTSIPSMDILQLKITGMFKAFPEDIPGL